MPSTVLTGSLGQKIDNADIFCLIYYYILLLLYSDMYFVSEERGAKSVSQLAHSLMNYFTMNASVSGVRIMYPQDTLRAMFTSP